MGVATSTVGQIFKTLEENTERDTSNGELNASNQRCGGILSESERKRITDSLEKLRVS